MIKQVTYKRGMLDTVRDVRKLPSHQFDAPNIPKEILDAIERERLLELDGSFGNPAWGAPIEYDRLSIDHDDGTTLIEVSNRMITLIHAESEQIKRIHRVCCLIQSKLPEFLAEQ